MKEANNRLTITINDKEYEVSALKEKTNTLSKLLEQQGAGEKVTRNVFIKDRVLEKR